jgi:excisionase family DNA binding protein
LGGAVIISFKIYLFIQAIIIWRIVQERLYTLKEACLLLGLHPRTIQKRDKQGKIRVVRTIGGRRRIPESEIRRMQGGG